METPRDDQTGRRRSAPCGRRRDPSSPPNSTSAPPRASRGARACDDGPRSNGCGRCRRGDCCSRPARLAVLAIVDRDRCDHEQRERRLGESRRAAARRGSPEVESGSAFSRRKSALPDQGNSGSASYEYCIRGSPWQARRPEAPPPGRRVETRNGPAYSAESTEIKPFARDLNTQTRRPRRRTLRRAGPRRRPRRRRRRLRQGLRSGPRPRRHRHAAPRPARANAGEAGARFELLIPSAKLGDALAALSAHRRGALAATRRPTTSPPRPSPPASCCRTRRRGSTACSPSSRARKPNPSAKRSKPSWRRSAAIAPACAASSQHLERRADYSRVLGPDRDRRRRSALRRRHLGRRRRARRCRQDPRRRRRGHRRRPRDPRPDRPDRAARLARPPRLGPPRAPSRPQLRFTLLRWRSGDGDRRRCPTSGRPRRPGPRPRSSSCGAAASTRSARSRC